MAGVWGSVGTFNGEVRFDGDELRISKSPTATVRGYRARWRHGDRGDRTLIALGCLGFAVLIAFVAVAWQSGYGQPDSLAGWVLQYGVTLLLFAGNAYRNYHDLAVPLDAVEDVALDEDDRELSVTYEPRSRLWPDWFPDTREASVRFRTPENCREAKRLVERFERTALDGPDPTTPASGGDRHPGSTTADSATEVTLEND